MYGDGFTTRSALHTTSGFVRRQSVTGKCWTDTLVNVREQSAVFLHYTCSGASAGDGGCRGAPVDLEGVGAGLALKALAEHQLEDVARLDVLLRLVHCRQVLLLRSTLLTRRP